MSTRTRNEIETRDISPMTGDYILLKNGTYLRVTTELSSEAFQAYECGSFHLSANGGISHSGSCGDVFQKSKFKLSTNSKAGSFWFWHTEKGIGGGNGAYASALFRVFKEI